ncbi:inorganic pyrophosphatase-like [Nilaparvata lugens]|uniref:inorganic pyrophosphatase-like n=1 Tax=Nilaparvata lugens TaxID=108931 RepID=UPI00193D3427|nr:inorganic pyrophosphatase-like [Nilaparvata lugens]
MALSRVVLSLLKLKVSYSCQLELRKSIPKYFFNNNTRLISTAAIIDKTKKMPFETVEAGTPNGDDFRIYYKNENGPVSPLHDIPLYADPANNVFNMVVEIPRWTNAKMETWENPAHVDSHTNHKGDNDPIDVLEIGHRVAKRGEIIQVKVLGTIALIDEGETDWKIFTIDVNDPQAQQMNDINDVEKFFPGLLKASVEWFKIYKIPDGKPENKFAFNGEAKNSEFALNIVRETHKFWNGLIKKELDGGKLSCSNVSIEGSPFKIGLDEANNILNQAPKPGTAKGIDSIGKIFFNSKLIVGLY